MEEEGATTTEEAMMIGGVMEVAEHGTMLVEHIQEMIVVTAIERTEEGLAEGIDHLLYN